MKLVISLATTAALLAAAPALAQQAPAQSPSVEQTQQAESAQDEALQQLARDAHAARMLGILAADKNVPVEVSLLGDSMVAANSEIELRLAEIVRERGLEVPQFSPDETSSEYADLVALNQQEFTDGFANRIGSLYPQLIDRLDQAAAVAEVAELRDQVGPRLEKHLDAAKQLAQQGEIDQQTAEVLRQEGPIERKDSPEVTRGEGGQQQ